jgi:hypothetical protein
LREQSLSFKGGIYMDELTQNRINAKMKKEEGQLYMFVGENKKRVPVDILDQVYGGEKVSIHIKDKNDAISLINDIKSGLNAFLRLNGYDIVNGDVKDVIAKISKMHVINPFKQYVTIGLKKDYICPGNNIVVELNNIDEKELYKGYCKIENRKVIIDDSQKIKYLETLKGGM